MRVLRIVLILLLTLIVGVISLSYFKSHGQPYSQEIDAKLIPVFTPASLDFVHVHDENALPMIASAIIDIGGDSIPELFLGGGRRQADAVFRYTETGFVAVEGAAGISKDLADASYGAGTIDVDGDGDSDLFVARDSGVTLYLNEGGRFVAKPLDIPFDDDSTPLSFAFNPDDEYSAPDPYRLAGVVIGIRSGAWAKAETFGQRRD